MPTQSSGGVRERLRRVSEAREQLARRIREAREAADLGVDELDELDDQLGSTIVVLGDDDRLRPEERIPAVVRSASAWSWRILVIAAAIVVIGYAIWQLHIIVFPVVAALLLAALLSPAVGLLTRRRVPRPLAAAIVFVLGLALVAGVLTFLIRVLTTQLGDISDNIQDGIRQIRSWLANGPLDLSEGEINRYLEQLIDALSDNRDLLAGGAIGAATAAFEIVTGALLVLFSTYFFLYDGERIWRWCARLFPSAAERSVHEAGRRAWRVLTSYVRATVVIAAVDAVGIGLLLAILGVPLALPLGVLVFFGAFVPIVGATITGAVAVLVALVSNGPVTALGVLAGVIAIQQLEGHILQPLIMGRFVRVHPLAIVLSVAAGGVLAGIWGTVLAVPFVAVTNTVIAYFASIHRAPPAVAAAAPGGAPLDPPPADEPVPEPPPAD